MIETRLLKKAIFIISIILIFYTSYIFKNFQLFLISITFFISIGFLFKKLNKNYVLFIFSFFFIISILETSLFYFNNKMITKLEKTSKTSKKIKYKKTFLGFQPVSGIQNIYSIGNNNYRITPKINNKKKDKSMNFFGGSFVFGSGLNDDETLPYLSQKYFKNWNIENYGINGYGVHQMLTQIINDPKKIQDINILITHKFHVPRSSCKRDYSFGTPRYILKNNKIVRKGYCNNYFFKAFQLPKIFGSIINRSEIKKLIDKLYFKKDDFNNNDVELYLSIILEIDKIIKQNQKLFTIGYIVNDKHHIDKIILEKLNQNNINIIDLSLDPNNKKNFLPDRHPSKEANEKRSLILWNNLKNL